MDLGIDIVWYTFIFIAFTFCIFGVDTFFFDLYYIVYSICRYYKKKKYAPLSYARLVMEPEQKIAIIVPCWQESNVIGDMLRHNVRNIDYKNYTIYVGAYPNDPETIIAVQNVANMTPHVRCVVQNKPGPTNKAGNLNGIYEVLLAEEKASHSRFDIIILHDSEDTIHSLSLKLYNHLIPAKDMVQTPVFPLEVNYFNFTHWLYNDEFAEHHLKNMMVREAMGGLVPSAGVGTAFSRKAIQVLIENNHSESSNQYSTPFDIKGLTEDYHSALILKLAGLKTIFVVQSILKACNEKTWFGTKKIVREYIATREKFPTEYIKSERQRARWIIGISMQEWAQTGWRGRLPVLYTLYQDRRALATFFVAGISYIVLGLSVYYAWWQPHHPEYPTVSDVLDRWPPIFVLIYIATLLMFERIAMRMYCCWKVYSIIPAILSIPRSIYGNVLNLHAVFRAYKLFFFRTKASKPIKWDKTDHTFPTAGGLVPAGMKLGEYLIQYGLLDKETCVKIIDEQWQTGKKFGEILIEMGILDKTRLLQILAEQYGLVFLKNVPSMMPKEEISHVSRRQYRWLRCNKIIPVRFTEAGELIVAIPDPSDANLIDKATYLLKNYDVKYVVYEPNEE